MAKRLPVQILVALALTPSLHVSSLAQEEIAPSNSAQPAIQFRVLESRRVSLGNRSIVFNRVEPPPKPAVSTTASAPAAEKVGTDEEARRQAAQAERKQWLRDHPPLPKDTVINFWPVKSRRYPTRNN
jgi:hypothetical protein